MFFYMRVVEMGERVDKAKEIAQVIGRVKDEGKSQRVDVCPLNK